MMCEPPLVLRITLDTHTPLEAHVCAHAYVCVCAFDDSPSVVDPDSPQSCRAINFDNRAAQSVVCETLRASLSPTAGVGCRHRRAMRPPIAHTG